MRTATPSRAMRLAAVASQAYRRVFAASRLAPLLSRPNPVHRTGYDLDVVVRRIAHEAEDVVSLTLAPTDGYPLPAWLPGAHLDVFLPSGRQRQYSLCGNPNDRSVYRIAVRRMADGDGGSREIHDGLSEGDLLRVRGPRNAFSLVGTADAYLFVAGGIGITPILPMVRACHERGAPWRLVYLGRSRTSMPFLAELERHDGAVDIRPDDEYGPPDLAAILSHAPRGAAVCLCGPPPLMAPAQRIMRSVNPSGSLHAERFSPPTVAGGQPFAIHLRRSDITVEVGAAESALAAIRRALPDVTYSCRQGFCGTCRVRVLDGEVEHRDRLLTDTQRRDSMLVCVSRAAAGPLVLDL
ncbi:ferredoxin-NADP reductase [Kibdelosporangium banguiense]|uniref:Ferredoxin-NADP reductase n=1 Tax=Kibdelosporangium banguiense TaxID=1365924 RepID=A0ABS4TJ35_9PSEU|nr:PDR/VanB family oxidoreductase [Kibdelosporangium banguiense]MBP2324432.1 ferredoxin-NADP reductase [Kibdelosporangium banguiense]